MSHWRRYPIYKDSAVEWLGEVPEGWENWKLSHSFKKIGSGTTPLTDKTEFYDNGAIPWVNTSELRENILLDTEKKITKLALREYSALKIYPKNSLLFAMYGATIGRLAILGIPATVNQACCVFSDSKVCDIKFVFYWLWMRKNELIVVSSGGGQPNLNQEKLREIRIPIPPLFEQTTIAAFLNRETARIDALISKKERQIELLQEKRAALISHAVIKGLDPNVKMKDSGVEWIGEVPEHWIVGKLGAISIVKARLGWRGLKASEYVEEGFVFLSTPNIKENEIDFKNVDHITPSRYYESPEIMLSDGDVLLAKDGSTLGTVNVIRKLPSPATVNSSIAVIKPKEKVCSIFLFYFLRSRYTQDVITQIKGGMGVPHLFQWDIRKFIILLPSEEEQSVIATYLDEESARIDSLIEKIRHSKDLLKEYRTSLISAAVTGKIDVRGEVKA